MQMYASKNDMIISTVMCPIPHPGYLPIHTQSTYDNCELAWNEQKKKKNPMQEKLKNIEEEN